MLSRLMTRKEQAILFSVAVALIAGAVSLAYHDARQNRAEPEPVQVPLPRVAPPVVTLPPPEVALPKANVEPAVTPVPEQEIEITTHFPSPPKKIGVAAMGAVRREGMYYLDEGARVGDLLEKAGGPAEDAHLDDIDLAARLIDATTLTVPRKINARRDTGQAASLRRVETAPNPAPYTHSGKQAVYAPAASSQAAPGIPQPASGLINLNTASQAELESLPGIGPALASRIIAHRQGSPFNSIDDLLEVNGIGPVRLAEIRSRVTAP